MWHLIGTRQFEVCIKSIHRNSLRCAYFLQWEGKEGKAVPIKSYSRKYQGFQCYAVFCTLIILPVYFLRWYQILTASPGSITVIQYYACVVGTIMMLVGLPFLWFFSKKSNLRKFVTYFHEVLNLDKRFCGK